MEKFGILLLGHGSSLPHNKKLVEKTAEMIRKKKQNYSQNCISEQRHSYYTGRIGIT
jgi:hypothetical protein